MIESIGFMQGRLSPLINGKIQSFPVDTWRDEFPLAHTLGLRLMEWTLDHERLSSNPLLTPSGQNEIHNLCQKYHITIPSLTGDCFMQAPFWKSSPQTSDSLKGEFIAIAHACSQVGIQLIVVPLVDNGSLLTDSQESTLISFMREYSHTFNNLGIRILFESDYTPDKLARFMERLPEPTFGINYDTGNSAAFGYLPADEFAFYGKRIANIHIKDRLLGGPTVELGFGSTDFPQIFKLFDRYDYRGNLILQGARAVDGDHVGILQRYISRIHDWALSD